MSKIKVGSIVKFTDSEGRLDGGTVIDFLRKDNQECLLINSLEGKKIVKKRVEVSLIQRQQRGRVAASFLVDMKEEFDKANKEAGLGIIPMEEKTEEVKLNIISSKQQSQKDGGVSTEAKAVPPYVSSYIENKVKKLTDSNKLLQLQIQEKDEEIAKLKEELQSLRSKEESKAIANNENLTFTVKALGDALLISSLSKEGDVVAELLKIVNKLNNIE